MKVQHTPGPWHVHKQVSGDFVALLDIDSNVERVASVNIRPTLPFEANANLIAAAPELLAKAIELLKNATYRDGQAIVLTHDCEALEAAIAKARGVL